MKHATETKIRLRDAAGVSIDIETALCAVPYVAKWNPELAEKARVILTSALWAQRRSDATYTKQATQRQRGES